MIDLLRAHQLSLIERQEALRCTVEGCQRGTREGKPWCPRHVMESPHARAVRQAVEAREAADAGGQISRDLVDDAWNLLGERRRVSVAGLARALNVRAQTARRLALQLEREGAKVATNRRGTRTVGLQ